VENPLKGEIMEEKIQAIKKEYTFKEISSTEAVNNRFLDIQDYRSHLLVTGMKNALEVYDSELRQVNRIQLELKIVPSSSIIRLIIWCFKNGFPSVLQDF
jgi:hypothetical protein